MKINSNIIINSESRIRIKLDVKLNQNKNQRKLCDLRNVSSQIARLSSYSTVKIKKKKLKTRMAKEKREKLKIKNEKIVNLNENYSFADKLCSKIAN